MGPMPLSSQPLHLQAPTQDSLVSPSSQITSSPDSSENLSEIPLSSKGAPPASPVNVSPAASELFRSPSPCPVRCWMHLVCLCHPLVTPFVTKWVAFGATHSIQRPQCPERISHLLKDAQRAEDTIRSPNGEHMALRILSPLPTQ